MNFADQLRSVLQRRAPQKSVRSLSLKCGGALAALCLLPLCAGSASGALRALVALALVGGLALLAARRLGARAPETDPEALKVIARATLSSKNALAVVQVGGRRIVIAFGEGFTEVLASEPETVVTPGENR